MPVKQPRPGDLEPIEAASRDEILDCASASGMEVPYSCTSGVCGT
jgi:ferredoxin